MKTKLVIGYLVLYLILSVSLQAQPHPDPGRQKLNSLKKMLSLTGEQFAQIKDIIRSDKKKITELQEKMEETIDTYTEETHKILENQDQAIEKLLNKEQIKKFNELKKERNNMHKRLRKNLPEPPMQPEPPLPPSFPDFE